MSMTHDLIFSYQNMLTTNVSVTKHYLLLRCLPRKSSFYEILKLDFSRYGFDEMKDGLDSFSNPICYGGALNAHKTLMWNSSGVLRTQIYEYEDTKENYLFKLPSALTLVDESMKEFIDDKTLPESPFDKAYYLTELVHDLISYEAGVTNVNTTASEAFSLKKGVCQDYAHVLLAFLRYKNIPSKYVSGLISGDGKTHAWGEILIGDKWYGFDPTHNRKIDFGYVKLAHGRDANDCSVCRGVFTGDATQQMSVHVCVGEL